MKLRLTGGGGGNPTVEVDKEYRTPAKTSLDTTADVRDLISSIVGTGEIRGTDLAAKYQALRTKLGDATARKLFDHLMIYNQRNDMQGQPVEKRIQSLYEIGSSDPELKKLLGEVKSFGYGVIPGFRESGYYSNQLLGGRVKEQAANLDDDTEKKIMLKVAKNM